MIKLEHINEKSFNDFSVNDPNLVKQINVIFGRNGSGKTALSSHLKSIYPNELKVFDTDYVDRNLKASNTVKGTNLIIGSEQIDLSSLVEQTKKILTSLDSSKNDIQQEIFAEKKILNQLMKNVTKNFKTSKNINQKPNATQNPTKAIKLWKEEVTKHSSDTQNFTSSEDIENILSETRTQIGYLNPILLDFDDSRRRGLIMKMKDVVLKPESDITNTIISWLQQGLSLHNLDAKPESLPEEMKCLFCGNSFKTESTVESIELKINSDYAKLISAIQRLRDQLNDAIKSIDDLGEVITNNYKETALSEVQQLLSQLNYKEHHTDSSINLEANLFEHLDELNKQIGKQKVKLKQEEKLLIQKQLNIEAMAKYRIGLEISENESIKEHVNKLRSLERALEDQVYAQSLSNKYLLDLNNRANNLEGFKEMMNHTLYSLGLGFKLEFSSSDQNSFDIQLTGNSQADIQVHSLSEGEIRLIAFIKFYLGLFSKYTDGENDRKLKREFDSTVKLIILDDPITSIDSNNRYFMTTLINRLLGEAVKSKIDVVILTHSIYDFHNFAYTMQNKVGHFRIVKNEQAESEIEPIEQQQLKNYSDDYRATFSEVANFCCLNSRSLPDTQQYIRYGNQCRFLLETHARSNYNIENVTNKSINSIMDAYEVEDRYENRVSTMLDTINALSHGISYTWDYVSNISASEIQKAARIMIWMLYKKDRQHVTAMAGLNSHNIKTGISNWNLE